MAGADPTTTTITTSCNDSCSNNNTSSSSNNKMYKGVRKRKWGKWVSEIRLPNSRERIWLGSYDTQEKAARAFDAALYCLRGRHASFNFPDTPLYLEINNVASVHGGDQSLSPQEIQEVAAKFANNNGPPMELMMSQEEQEQEQEQVPSYQSSQHGGGANSKSSNSITESEMSTTYSSRPLYDYDGTVQVEDYGDLRTMDWTFSDMLDDLNNGVAGSDFGLYSGGPDKMQYYSGELLYSTQHYEDNGDEIEGEDAFSNHSFLWSWNF